MSDRVGVGERMSVKDKMILRSDFKLQGVYKIEEEDPITGERSVVVEEVENAIQTTGYALFIDLMIGDSADHLNQNCDLIINGSGGSTPYTLGSADAAPSIGTYGADGDPEISWTWSHDVVDVYTVTTLEVESPAGVTFSISSSGPFADNSKPADKNWIYTYSLRVISTSANFDDGVSGAYPGFYDIASIVTGDEITHLNWGTNLEVLDGAGAVTGEIVACDAGFPTRTDPDTSTTEDDQVWFRWTAHTTDLVDTSGDAWETLRVRQVFAALGSDAIIREGADGLGPKNNTTQREVTWSMTFS